MTTLDIIFAVVLASAFYKGYSKGIIRAVLSVVVWVFGWMIATRLSSSVTTMLGDDLQDSKLAPILSFILVFIAIGFVVRYLGRFSEKILKTVMLGWANRLAGALVYTFAGALICSGFLWLLDSLHIMEEQKTDSALYSYLQPIAPSFAESTDVVFPFLEKSYQNISEVIVNHVPTSDHTNTN